MAIVRWDPFSEMVTMQRDLNRLFDSFGMPLFRGDGERVAWTPTIDVLSQGDDLVVRAELPGVKPEDVEVSLSDDVLTVRGSRSEEIEHKDADYLRKESSFGIFERQIMLPANIDAGKITADYNHGVLKVVVPKAAKAVAPQTRKIAVKGAEKAPARTQLKKGKTPAKAAPKTRAKK